MVESFRAMEVPCESRAEAAANPVIVAIACVILLAACGDDSPPDPAKNRPPSIARQPDTTAVVGTTLSINPIATDDGARRTPMLSTRSTARAGRHSRRSAGADGYAPGVIRRPGSSACSSFRIHSRSSGLK